MKKLLSWLLLLVCFVAARLPATAAEEAPDGWVAFSINEEALRCGNHSKHEWEVKLESGRVLINPFSLGNQRSLPFNIAASEEGAGLQGERHIEKVNDGWLVGFDAGEWGGSLWWFDEDGKGRKKLADENVVGLTRASAEILALTGLAHLGMDYGKVLRVKQDGGDWKADVLADLGAAPRTFVVESPSSVLVITTKSLIRVKTTGVVDPLLQTQYRFLYPNSMILSGDGVIHVGMRHFVTRLTPTATGYKEGWFVPRDCQRFELRGNDCVCLGTADQ